ncbi:hypothetical protein [Desertifilum sp. FACHB-866]|uniref:Uncharacterized protein n=2 Tax=Desertifilum tharense IPPAS B-1220 TaxID=1781255 RepID=A0ACD5GV67_9CYAN
MPFDIDPFSLVDPVCVNLKQQWFKSNKQMDRSKVVAVITGAISILLAIAYLIIVQILDFRGEMVPAPTSLIYPNSVFVQVLKANPQS